MIRHTRHLFQILLILGLVLPPAIVAHAQEREEPGKSIGKVSVLGNLILMELDKGALGQQNLFDLGQRTLRFTPDGAGYRVENLPLHWDADFGQELISPQVTLHNFSFPFLRKDVEFVFRRRHRLDSIRSARTSASCRRRACLRPSCLAIQAASPLPASIRSPKAPEI